MWRMVGCGSIGPNEPKHLAMKIAQMNLKYVVITSVDRDDLRDGGAGHFVECISEIRQQCGSILVEILVPDFRGRGRMDKALDLLQKAPPDVFNHNIEKPYLDYIELRELGSGLPVVLKLAQTL